jgi:hypothetical protein
MSNFRLYPVPESKLDNLKPILKKVAEDFDASRFKSPDVILQFLNAGYVNRSIDVYVDDVENPNHLLILAKVPSLWYNDMGVTVLLIFTVPEKRGDINILQTMLRTAESYAVIHGADYISGSSWVYRGHKGTDVIWKANDYTLAETVFTKHLI